MHRGEREAIVTAGYGSLQLIVDTPSEEIARTAKVSRGRVQGLQRKIVEILGPTLDLQRAQAVRLRACGQNTGLIETLYATKGKLLEQAIADVLSPPFCTLTVTRIGSQNEGEADLRFMLGDGGNGIAQVTAKDNPSDKVGLVKACSVLQQSPELSPRLFICFGRPDFDEKAIRKAAAHVSTGKNFKLIPVSTLAEMFVRFKEGSLTTAQTDQVLEERAGYIGLTELAILQRKAISPAPGPTEAPLKAVAGK